MKTILQVAALLAVITGTGDLLLRKLPDKILADLGQPANRAARQQAAPRVAPRPTSKPVYAFANGGLSPEEIALAGRVVAFSTQNLRLQFAAMERSGHSNP